MQNLIIKKEIVSDSMIGFTIYGKRLQRYCALLLSFVLSSNIYAQESEIKLEDWELILEDDLNKINAIHKRPPTENTFDKLSAGFGGDKNKVHKEGAVPWEKEISKGEQGKKE